MMIWVKFESLEAFNVWHDQMKILLGLPKISTDAEGNPVPEAIMTTDYVLPIIVSDNDIRALIDEEYAGNLEHSETPFVSRYDQANA